MSDRRLSPCASFPNCVSSDADDGVHRVEPFRLRVPPTDAWETLILTIETTPRQRIVERTDTYLRAECRIPVFGFIDDLELELRPADNIIAVRSASRVGQYDLGVNRRRVERLRKRLRRDGVID